MRVRVHTRDGASPGRGGKLFLTLFGLVFGSMGLAFVLVILRSAVRQHAVERWTPTRCVIESATVNESGDGYQLDVRYGYEYGGQRHVASRYDLGGGHRFDEVARKQPLLDTYAEGREVQCFVNPENPSEAVLVRGGSVLPHLGGVLFASIFVLIGYGMVIGAWSSRKTPAAAVTKGVTTVSQGRNVGRLFSLVFILIGLIIPYFTFVRPYQRQQAAQQWTPVEARVERSMVRSHRGDDSTTYSVYIAYSYTLENRRYEGDRYSFVGGSSSGYGSKAAIVQQHPPGSRVTVYVDPANPSESVILREAGSSLYLGLIPLVFAGFGMLFWWLMGRQAATAAFGQAPARSARLVDRTRTPPPFKSAHSRIGRLVGITFAALFWNGIVSIFLVQVVKEWARGRHPIFLTLFLTPFVLIGAGLLGGIVYEFLRLFNPRFELREVEGVLSPGGTASASFQIVGNLQRLTSLTITLCAREEATYQRGTNSQTDKHVFLSQTRFETQDPRKMGAGVLEIPIPAGTMHSFEAAHNKIIWALKVQGRIPRWPDLSEEFLLNVVPNEVRR